MTNLPLTNWAVKCERCGQVAIATIRDGSLVCEPCRSLEREPQGEAMRLFAPAPNQTPGQLTF